MNVVVFSMHRGHGITDQCLVDGRCCLYVGRDDDCMLLQVQLERVAGPAPLDLHDIEGDSLE